MSDLNTQMQVRVNKKKLVEFRKVAKALNMKSGELVRVMMDAAIDGTLRIAITPKTTVTIQGVHINA